MLRISNKNANIFTAVGILIIALIFLISGLGRLTKFINNYYFSKQISVRPDAYQAVFLNNDQTYFGRMRPLNSEFMILDDVYYVRLSAANPDDPDEQVRKGTLVPLGQTEPHGPVNQMIINNDHILFWEDLKPDSQVMKTINAYKAQKR